MRRERRRGGGEVQVYFCSIIGFVWKSKCREDVVQNMAEIESDEES